MATEEKKEGRVSDYLTPGSMWKNELKSIMEISKVDAVNGNFTGTYYSAVGKAEKTYELQGRFDTDGLSLGWVVAYKNEYRNAHSTATWSGQMQLDTANHKPVIFTTWILTRQNDGGSTRVGSNTFHETIPEEAAVDNKDECSQPKDAS